MAPAFPAYGAEGCSCSPGKALRTEVLSESGSSESIRRRRNGAGNCYLPDYCRCGTSDHRCAFSGPYPQHLLRIRDGTNPGIRSARQYWDDAETDQRARPQGSVDLSGRIAAARTRGRSFGCRSPSFALPRCFGELVYVRRKCIPEPSDRTGRTACCRDHLYADGHVFGSGSGKTRFPHRTA